MSTPLQLRFPSSPARITPVRIAVEEVAAQAGFPERAIGEIGLCVNEAIANVIRHAYRGRRDQPIELTALVDAAGSLIVTIRDWGIGVAPGPLPSDVPDPHKPGGLGLVCLGRLMDKVSFLPQPDGMLLELVRDKRRGET